MEGIDAVATGRLVGGLVLGHVELAIERIILPTRAIVSFGSLQMALRRHLPRDTGLSLLVLYESIGGQIVALASAHRDEFTRSVRGSLLNRDYAARPGIIGASLGFQVTVQVGEGLLLELVFFGRLRAGLCF